MYLLMLLLTARIVTNYWKLLPRLSLENVGNPYLVSSYKVLSLPREVLLSVISLEPFRYIVEFKREK